MRAVALLLFLAGCPWVGGKTYEERVEDADGDGERAVRYGGTDCRDDDPAVLSCDVDRDGAVDVRFGGDDCDDEDAAIGPAAIERCDGIDNDCDGLVDDLDQVDPAQLTAWYPDADADGYGRDEPTLACAAPTGHVADGGDCNDGRTDVSPGALERCDAIDHDCNGVTDNDPSDAVQWFADADGDGAGGASLVYACTAPSADAVAIPGDCDDADPARSLQDVDLDGVDSCSDDCDDDDASRAPGLPELCDGVDNDCNGLQDDTLSFVTYWPDLDGDGAGDPAGTAVSACAPVAGHATAADDCDDHDASRNPAAPEICDGVDNDCDGQTDDDDGAVTYAESDRWYPDADLDGYGSSVASLLQCTAPAGFVQADGDCNDAAATLNPGALERCDCVDNDCDGRVDEEAVDASIYYPDADGDGHGNAGLPTGLCTLEPELTCGEPLSGAFVTSLDDCNDANPTISPSEPEICGDSIRQDCSAADPFDCDADGAVDLASGGTDCDDGDPTRYPTAAEICDGLDNDCDGLLDDQDDSIDLSTAADWFVDQDGDGFGAGQATFQCQPPPASVSNGGDCDDHDPDLFPGQRWYRDADGDGYGDVANVVIACDPPVGRVLDATDCDDALAGVHPDATETCDGVDNDCNGSVDDNAVGGSTYYRDNDGDSYGSASLPVLACGPDASGSLVLDATDCNDANAGINPGAVEICGDNVRQDCQPADVNDCDADGFLAIQAGGLDCDDEQPTVFPNALETCDGDDNDCDGLVDDADPDVEQGSTAEWKRDADGDGRGNDLDVVTACSRPVGYVIAGGDCNDQVATIRPGAPEICDLVDNDCDALIDDADQVTSPPRWYRDIDLDTYGDISASVLACVPPAGNAWVTDSSDCNDVNANAYPGASETCDGVDNDCDTAVDDADTDVENATRWYRDADQDSYVLLAVSVASCTPPPGFIADAGLGNDCNDANPAVNPGAQEACAPGGVDDDCDGLVDAADPDLAGTSSWYPDADGDGYGSNTGSVIQCTQPAGYIALSGDCNDLNPALNPNAPEICDGIDNDCNLSFDDGDPGLVGALSWYRDADGDGYGVGTAVVQCAEPLPPGSHKLANGDCNDAAAAVNPGRPEICDPTDRDEDCDGLADDADDDVLANTLRFFVFDADGDGFGDLGQASTPLEACDPPTAHHLPPFLATDCDDTDPAINTLATEVYYNGEDDDCSAATRDGDQDNDGFLATLVGGTDCIDDPQHPGFNPLNPRHRAHLVFPGSAESPYDNIDQDCNGQDDWDVDGDGQAAIAPPGWPYTYAGVLSVTDCNDTDAAVLSETVTVPGDYANLQAAVDASCPGGVIRVTASAETQLVVRGRDVTIEGVGDDVILSGASSHRVIEVFDGERVPYGFTASPVPYRVESDVTVRNLGIQDGFAPAFGGAVVVYPDQRLAMRDVHFEGNVTTGDGGAMYVTFDAALTLEDVVFEDNAAGSFGILTISTGSSAVLTDVVFLDNTVGDRGALYAQGFQSLAVQGAVFDGNYAVDPDPNGEGQANAIYLDNPALGGTAVLTDVDIQDPEDCEPPNDNMLPTPCAEQAVFSASPTVEVTFERLIAHTWRRALSVKGLATVQNSVLTSLSSEPFGFRASEEGLIEARNARLILKNNLIGFVRVGDGDFDHPTENGVINLLQARLVAHDNLLFNVGVTDCNAGMPRCFAFIYVEDSTGLITHDIRGNVFQSPDAGGTPPPWTNDPSVFPLMLPNCEDVGPTVNCLNSTSEMFPTINRFGMVRTFHPRLPRNRWDLALRGDADILTQGVGSETAGPHGIVGAPPLSYYADTAPADGIPDGWMARYPLLPLPFDPHGDFDGDGVDNQTEFDAGTSPTDPDTDGDGCNDGFSAMGEDTQPLDPTYPSGACN